MIYQFEKILAINLPSRSDRRDLLTLGALQTDVELEWIDGVQGSDISPKAWVRPQIRNFPRLFEHLWQGPLFRVCLGLRSIHVIIETVADFIII